VLADVKYLRDVTFQADNVHLGTLSIDKSLGIGFGSFGPFRGSIRSVFGNSKAVAYEPKLKPEQTKLDDSDNYKAQSEETSRIVRQPLPNLV
jgi:hypothetical protein